MEGTQQQSINAPIVRCSCGCLHRSKNRVSPTKVPTQEEDRRGEFNSDTALTQKIQGAQAVRVQSINPWLPKLTQKPTKVTITKMVRNKNYKPYISDGNQEVNDKPKFYRTTEGKLVLKKVAAFYNKVPMPCNPVTNQDPGLSEPSKCHSRFHHAKYYPPKQEGSKSCKTFIKIDQVNGFK
ncbi:hypothetical protein DSO57_1017199 [Entomophthora muscae]|uniref:Uncharacterized protein n=1 Tax=Entomophthora muscae TaxID=34485 RepID=A0ACC2SHC7_9FUNG|nr:hypothetical protein DSO57_1017199 [Entomophthora muscae]